MLDTTTASYEYAILIAAVISVVLPLLSVRLQMPLFMVIGRWIRWFLFAAIFSFFLITFEISFRPNWVHFITGLALWFLLESGYNWIAIKALSRSEIPLFPSFKENTDGDEWPADQKWIELKDWLKQQKYRRAAGLKAELFAGTFLRASIYESEDGITRIQILFIPKRKDGATACYSISSVGKDDKRLVTDNLYLPYGGYYPESWDIVRKPLTGSLKRLLACHRKRILKSSITPIAFDQTPLEELNEQQGVLERLNTETGFLTPRRQQAEKGKITYEGRYRLWKEMWFLAYFGRSI